MASEMRASLRSPSSVSGRSESLGYAGSPGSAAMPWRSMKRFIGVRNVPKVRQMISHAQVKSNSKIAAALPFALKPRSRLALGLLLANELFESPKKHFSILNIPHPSLIPMHPYQRDSRDLRQVFFKPLRHIP